MPINKVKCDICGCYYEPIENDPFKLGLNLQFSDYVGVVKYEKDAIYNVSYNVCRRCADDVDNYINERIKYWNEF